MWLRFHLWFAKLSPLKQLLLLFMLNTLLWFAAWRFYFWYFKETPKPMGSQILFALWMSFLLTIPLNLKKVQQIFKKKNRE